MTHDLFDSYSLKDTQQADRLSELRQSAGLSVGIDRSGIDVSTNWSGEIVDTIEGRKTMEVLLSPLSILPEDTADDGSLRGSSESEDVMRESEATAHG